MFNQGQIKNKVHSFYLIKMSLVVYNFFLKIICSFFQSLSKCIENNKNYLKCCELCRPKITNMEKYNRFSTYNTLSLK